MYETINVIFLALVGSVLALVGGVVFLYKRSWSQWLASYSIPFAAGVLLTVALLSLLPEATHTIGENSYLIVLLTFLAAYIFENFFFSLHHHDNDTHHHAVQKSVPLVILGDTIHNFIDGVAIAAAYLVSPSLGLVTAVSTFLHEVPHEIGDFGILLKSGWGRQKILWVNLISALMTVVGALFVIYFVQDVQTVGSLMAIAAGIFLYLGASDFLPQIQEEKISPTKALVALLVGSAIMFAVIKMIPHSEGTESTTGYAYADSASQIN